MDEPHSRVASVTDAPRDGAAWKASEVASLRFFWEVQGLSVGLIADILGRRVRAVQIKAYKLGLRRSMWFLQEHGKRTGMRRVGVPAE